MKGGDKDGISTNEFPKLRWAVHTMLSYFNGKFTLKAIKYTLNGFHAILKINFRRYGTENHFKFRSAEAYTKDGYVIVTSGFLNDLYFMLKLIQ